MKQRKQPKQSWPWNIVYMVYFISWETYISESLQQFTCVVVISLCFRRFFIYLHHEGLFKCFITFLSIFRPIKVRYWIQKGTRILIINQSKLFYWSYSWLVDIKKSGLCFFLKHDLIGSHQLVIIVFDLRHNLVNWHQQDSHVFFIQDMIWLVDI